MLPQHEEYHRHDNEELHREETTVYFSAATFTLCYALSTHTGQSTAQKAGLDHISRLKNTNLLIGNTNFSRYQSVNPTATSLG